MSFKTHDNFPKMGQAKKSGSYVKGGSAPSAEPRTELSKSLPGYVTDGNKGTPGSAPKKSTADPKISGKVKK